MGSGFPRPHIFLKVGACMASFVGSCVSLFGQTLAAIMTVDIFNFFLAVLLVAVAFSLVLLFTGSMKM